MQNEVELLKKEPRGLHMQGCHGRSISDTGTEHQLGLYSLIFHPAIPMAYGPSGVDLL